MDQSDVRTTSVITCPSCGASLTETMPANACQFFWECPTCHAIARPKQGDCCVYCSYGSIPCPPVQVEGGKHCC